jgi:hypothetical protein
MPGLARSRLSIPTLSALQLHMALFPGILQRSLSSNPSPMASVIEQSPQHAKLFILIIDAPTTRMRNF